MTPEERKKAEDLAMEIENAFNQFGSHDTAEVLSKHFLRTHRTIQQSIVRGMFVFLRDLAKEEYFDARNENAVKAAKLAVEAIDREKISFPLI